MKPYVFLGPSLSVAEARKYLDAVYLPPVAQGEVASLIASACPPVIGIIDGYFQGVPSVWHKEILLALARGTSVVGASSMGALRAAELHAFGMLGVGRVFEWYRDGVIESDDEVALLHGPEETGFLALSEPLVNIRATLHEAVRQNVIPTETADRLIDLARNIFYGKRHYGLLLERAVSQGIAENELTWLEAFIKEHRIDQKKLDAIQALRLIGDLAGNPNPDGPAPRFELQQTIFLHDLLDRDQLVPVDGNRLITNEHIVNHSRLTHPCFEQMRASLVDENIILRYANILGVRVGQDELQSSLDAFRHERGLLKKADILCWLDVNRMTLDQLGDLLERRLLVAKTRKLCSRVEHQTVLDCLRIEGAYPATERGAYVCERAAQWRGLTKESKFGEAELVDFYCLHNGRERPQEIEALVEEFGFSDRLSLIVELKKFRYLHEQVADHAEDIDRDHTTAT